MASSKAIEVGDENYEDEPDETLSERLWGLTEMFPDRVRAIGGTVYRWTTKGVYFGYRFSRSALWIGASSLAIMVFPIMLESERMQLQEQQQMQQRQVYI
jgi:import receptor subunit TOM22